jgi:hypothetical protein
MGEFVKLRSLLFGAQRNFKLYCLLTQAVILISDVVKSRVTELVLSPASYLSESVFFVFFS